MNTTSPDSLLRSPRLRLAAAVWLLGIALVSQAQDRIPQVAIATAERTAIIEEVPLTGTLTSPRVAQISTSVGGLVDTVAVEAGDRVAQGEVLVVLDRELQRLALASARAATDQARAELADVRRRLDEARALRRRQSFPETEVRSLEAQVQIGEAEVARLEAERQRQAERLRRHELVAPFAGVISHKLTEAGEWVEPGSAVVELIAVDDLRVDFRVPQHYFPRIDEQSRLRVSLDAVPGRELEARIGTRVAVNDPASRTFLLRAYLQAGDVDVTPGMSAHGVLRLNTHRQDVTVPRDALLRYPDGRVTVWVVQGEGEKLIVTEHQVRTGVGFAGKVQIRSGLEAGARVVTAGNEALQAGQAVRLITSD